MGELIPLFPLGTPLFPGVVLPLNVFEPRYRRLVHELMAMPEGSDQRFFGVVAIRQGWEVEAVAPAQALYEVGCTARLQRVRPQPDGGFHIVTVGGDRFRLMDVVVDEEIPYLRGEIEWLPEDEDADECAALTEALGVEPALDRPQHTDPADDEAVAAVARGALTVLTDAVHDLFGTYVAEVSALSSGSGGEHAEADVLLEAVAHDPVALSWLVASAALLTTEDRQSLLAEPATRRRLAAESRLLRRELTLLQTLGAVPVPLRQFATPMTVN